MSDTSPLPQSGPSSATSVSPNAAASNAAKPVVAGQAAETDSSNAKAIFEAQSDPLQEVLQRLEIMQPSLARLNADLGTKVLQLSEAGASSENIGKQSFRQSLAYAFQDAERSLGGRLELSPPARAEVTGLAENAPGLKNDRMLAIMQSTSAMPTQAVVDAIRTAGRDIGKEADQNTTTVAGKIDTLENKIRLQQAPGAGVTSVEAPSEPKLAQASKTVAGDGQTNDKPTGPSVPADDKQSARATPNNGATRNHFILPRSPIETIFAALRPRETDSGAPWEPPHTPMKDRIAAFGLKVQERTDGETIQRVERSGRAALDALQGFAAGEGATVMNRIREAAKTEPGGMAAVLGEMKEGGRFADLRGQFNNALFDERGVTAAYDRAATALAKYGEKRTSLDEVIARRPDAANVAAKFDRMDGALGEAASEIPSRRDGKSMTDDLALAAADLFNRAVNGLKSMFHRTPNADAGTRPGPSPSLN